jgi:hypothetical protein
MFKNSVKTAIVSHPDSTILSDVYSWMRDDWEHLISHYMYASGGILLSFVYAFSFRNFVIETKLTNKHKLLWIFAAIIYGLTIGSIAVQFIKGSIVSLILCIGYGFGILGTFLYKSEGNKWNIIGRRIVIQYYILSYLIGLLITICWICAKGFKSRNEGA